MDDDLPRYLTAKQFAEQMQLSRENLYLKLQNGDVPGAKKVGGEWRIPRWALKEVGRPAHLATA